MKRSMVICHCALSLGIILVLSSASACGGLPAVLAVVEATESGFPVAPSDLKKSDLVYADRVAWHGKLKWPQECEESFDYPDKSFAGLAFFDLSANRYLVQVTCNLGTYQGTYIFLLLDESHSPSTSKLLTFVDWEDSGEPNRLQKIKAMELTGTPEFDPGKKVLRLTNRFRGIGDCGFLVTYSFTKEQPEVVSLSEKLNCDGKRSDPQEWKKVSVE